MADLCCPYTVAGLTINAATGDTLGVAEDGITGLDGRPIRRQIDPRGQADGGILHTARFGPRIIRFKTIVQIRSVPVKANDAYFAAINAVETAVIAALEAVLNSDTTLAWTPTGQSAQSLTVRYGVAGEEVRFPGTMMSKTCLFALVAADDD